MDIKKKADELKGLRNVGRDGLRAAFMDGRKVVSSLVELSETLGSKALTNRSLDALNKWIEIEKEIIGLFEDCHDQFKINLIQTGLPIQVVNKLFDDE